MLSPPSLLVGCLPFPKVIATFPSVCRAQLDVLRTRFITTLVLDDVLQLDSQSCVEYMADYLVRCVLGNASHISAVSRPRMLQAEGLAPHISHASLQFLELILEENNTNSNGTLRTGLTLRGAGLGTALGDVLSVTVGQQSCNVLSVHPSTDTAEPSEITAVCTTQSASIRGGNLPTPLHILMNNNSCQAAQELLTCNVCSAYPYLTFLSKVGLR